MSNTGKDRVRLTDQLERFAQGVASGMTRSAALRAAYPLTAPKWAPDTVWNRAAGRMAANGKVSTRVAALHAAAEADLSSAMALSVEVTPRFLLG